MAICIDHNSYVYKNFIETITKNGSLESQGLTELKLDTLISHYIENYGRYPLVEELPKGLTSGQIADNINSSIEIKNARQITPKWKGSIKDFNEIIGGLPTKYKLIQVYTYDNIPILMEDGQPVTDEEFEIVSGEGNTIKSIKDIQVYEARKKQEDKKYVEKLRRRWAVINITEVSEEKAEEAEETKQSTEDNQEQENTEVRGIITQIIENTKSKKKPKFIAKWFDQGVVRLNNTEKQLNTLSQRFRKKFSGDYEIKIDADDNIQFQISGVPNILEINISDAVTEVTKNPATILNEIMDILEKKFGVKTIKVTDLDLASKKWNGTLSPKERTARAFIFNGNIYINIDRANIEDPVHELLHLFAAPMFTKEGLSKKIGENTLFDIISQLEVPESFNRNFKGSSKNELDIKEEYIVTELAKFLTGQPSVFNDNKIIGNNIVKDILNELWITVSGDNNANIFKGDILTMTLNDMLIAMNSRLIRQDPNIDDLLSQARLHRQHNNQINRLIKQGMIEEECK